ncbi:unnamed protein product, partial [Choristocarpus tenellus]
DISPATKELQETFALRRILLKHHSKSEDECHFVKKYLSERTTIWREPFWALITPGEKLEVAQGAKLRVVQGKEPEDFVSSDSTVECMIYMMLRGKACVQCFDCQAQKVEFGPCETFGYVPVPEVLQEEASLNVKAVKSNPRSKVYRGEREYSERRHTVTNAGRIRVKISVGNQYLTINGADVAPILKRQADKHQRNSLLKGVGFDLLGMGAYNESNNGKKRDPREPREPLMKEVRYGVGSVLVEEGSAPTMVFIIVEGECRIVKGKTQPPRPTSRREHAVTGPAVRSARYNLNSSQGKKVNMLLSSGFSTQLDICQLGSLGPKAIIGDIPVLLGGVQPASIVAKTPLTVLQCKAEKFRDQMDYNILAKKMYLEGALARKTRMEDRGTEVDRIMSFKGIPLLVDM